MSTFFNLLLQKVRDKAKEALNHLVNEGSKRVKEWVTNLVKEAANQAAERVSNALKSTIDSQADRAKASLLANSLAATTPKAPSKALNTEDLEEKCFDCPLLDETSAKKLFGDIAALPATKSQLSRIQKSNPTVPDV